MSQRFSLYELLTVDQNITFFGGIYGLDHSEAGRASRLRHRDGRTRRPRDDARARSFRRMAPAARARMRDSSRAADPLSRRADRRRRSAVAPPVLAAHRHAVAVRGDRAGDDALPRRSGAMPPRRAHSRRAPRDDRHGPRSQADLRGAADRRNPHRSSRGRHAAARRDGRRWRRPVCSAPRLHAVLRSESRESSRRSVRGCARPGCRWSASSASSRRSRMCFSTSSTRPAGRPREDVPRRRAQGAAADPAATGARC